MPSKIFEPSGQTGSDIQLAINAASTAGGGVVLLDGISYTDVSATIPSSDIHVIGTGKTRLLAPSSGNVDVLSAQGSSGQPLFLALDADQFSDSVVLTSVSGLSVGTFIEFKITYPNPYDTNTFEHRATVLSISGSSISFAPELPFLMEASAPHSVTQVSFLTGIKVRGISFDADGNTGISRGFNGTHLMCSSVEDCRFDGFVSAAGLMLRSGFWNKCADIYSYRCGSPIENDISIWRQTLGDFDHIASRHASGFGPGLYWSTNCSGRAWSSIKAHNRGVKFRALVMCSVDDVEGHQSGSTGIAITNGCERIQLSRVRACRNRGGSADNDVGVWFSDRSEKRVTINQLIARDNGTADIRLFASNSDNVIRMADYGVLHNYGANNTISAT